MSKAAKDRVDAYVRDLDEALSVGGLPSDEIAAELRSDLDDHIARFRSEGLAEDEAVERALGEMGNPFGVVHRMRRELAPLSRGPARMVRYVLAVGVLLWLLFLLWHMRGWSYGFPPGVYALFGGLHLPLILLLWPSIVWRPNWLFRVSIPAVLAVLLAASVMIGGRETSGVAVIGADSANRAEGAAVTAVPADPNPASGPGVPWELIGASSALMILAVGLLLAMQQRSQRRRLLLTGLVLLAGIEVPFQVEELLFRRDRDALVAFASAQEAAGLPFSAAPLNSVTMDSDELPPALREQSIWNREAIIRGQDTFTIWWTRPLSRGFSIVYESGEGETWIQD